MYRPKGVPFMYKGCTDVTDCYTSQQVMKKAGLDWTVDKAPILTDLSAYPNLTNSVVPNQYATFRTDTGDALGLVKGSYEIVQNIDAFKFFDRAIGDNLARWETAGCYDSGNKVFVSAKLPDMIFAKGDPVENYLVFVTSHDGSSGVKILYTPIRIRCFNMLNAAIGKSSAYINFRHTASVHQKLNIAAQVLKACAEKTRDLNEIYNQMANLPMKEQEAIMLFTRTVLNDDELLRLKTTGHTPEQLAIRNINAAEDANISTRKMNIIAEMNNYYYNGVAQREIVGTVWGAYNAVSGFYCNVDAAEGQKRMDSLLFGDKSKKIEKATKLITV